MSSRNFIIALTLIMVSGCSQSNEATNDPSKKDGDQNLWVWVDAPESSFVHQIADFEGNKKDQNGNPYGIYRCWDRGTEFQCLTVRQYFDDGPLESALGPSSRLIWTFKSKKLPNDHIYGSEDGYHCESHPKLSLFSESINRNGEKILSNYTETGQTPWTRRFVNDFLSRNNITGNPFFNCSGIDNIVSNGSEETVNSTLISYSDLMLE